MVKIAINGLGRIGRNFLRALLDDPTVAKTLQLVAINIGPANPDLIAYFLKYDTLIGPFKGNVRVENNSIIIDDKQIRLFAEKEPEKLPWGKLGIDWVVECSGHFTKAELARKHIQAGAKKVLISAPAKGEDVSIVPGVNQEKYNPSKDVIISLGSCTTNALVPLVKVLHDSFGIEQGYMTTAHAYTNSQVLLDVNDSDPRKSRAAAVNMIPAHTGANEMVDVIMPELAGRIRGHAIRIPLPKVSLIDFTFRTRKSATVEQIHAAFKQIENSSMKGILSLTMEPLVSSDFNGCSYSVVVDGLLTLADGNMGKVFGWYDNEWGYSNRLKDFLLYASTK